MKFSPSIVCKYGEGIIYREPLLDTRRTHGKLFFFEHRVNEEAHRKRKHKRKQFQHTIKNKQATLLKKNPNPKQGKRGIARNYEKLRET